MSGLAVVQPLARSAGNAWRHTAEAWAAAPTAWRVTTVLLQLLILAGVVLRIQGFGSPDYFTFDEQLFVPGAQQYLLGLPDTNDHPPLFKLLMSVGVLLFGYNSVGWRFPALCFGIQSILLGYWLAKALFRDARAGLFAAAFVAADGFFLSYSRVGLMDGVLASLLLWCMLAAATARTWRGVLATAALVGIATSVKWSGVLIAVPAVVTMWAVGRVPLRSLWWPFAVVPALHLSVWALAFWLTGRASDLTTIVLHVAKLYRHHVLLNQSSNPLASTWYTWPAFYHPVVVKYWTHGLSKYHASSLGNPALWVTIDLLFLAAPLYAIVRLIAARKQGMRERLRSFATSVRDWPLAKPVGILLLGWATMIAPWTTLRTQYSFLHYYLPSYGFALLLLGGLMARLERTRPRHVLVFVGLVVAVAAYFAPVWCEFPMAEASAFHRLILPKWRP